MLRPNNLALYWLEVVKIGPIVSESIRSKQQKSFLYSTSSTVVQINKFINLKNSRRFVKAIPRKLNYIVVIYFDTDMKNC